MELGFSTSVSPFWLAYVEQLTQEKSGPFPLSRLELKWSDLDSFQKDCLLLPNYFLILTVDFSFNEMVGLMVDVSILRAHNIRISFNAWLTYVLAGHSMEQRSLKCWTIF
jgi:hypothetical protein